jgi:D-aminopeptidase
MTPSETDTHGGRSELPVPLLSDAAAEGDGRRLQFRVEKKIPREEDSDKEALSRSAAKLVPFPEFHERLQEAAAGALVRRDQRGLFRFNPPCRFSLTFQNSAHAELGETLPGVSRPAARTLTFSTQDYLEGAKTLRAFIVLALAR